MQRFGSALNLNVHAHGLVLDGVYVEEGEGLRFVPLPAPSTEEVGELVATVAQRCERWLRAHGHGESEVDEDEATEDGLATVQAASVRGRAVLGQVRRVQRLGGREYLLPPRCASCHGYTLHAGVAVAAHDRQGLERLARYLCRPPLAKARLSRDEDGTVILGLKRAWSDGTTELRFTPVAFLERLVALIPPPRANQVLYHGVLAPHAAWRSRVVPACPAGPEPSPRKLTRSPSPTSKWVAWGALLKRVFGESGFACPVCHAELELRAIVDGPPASQRIVRGLRRCFTRSRGPPADTAMP